MFIWRRKMQFRQPCRKIFSKRPKLFRSKSEMRFLNYIFFQKKYFSSKCFSGHVECSFDNPVDFFGFFGKFAEENLMKKILSGVDWNTD